MVVEGLTLILDDLFHVTLFRMVHFHLFDAVVGSEVAFKVVGKKTDQLSHLFSVFLQIRQYFRYKIVQLLC